ncbi:MAG: 2-polyprenyl-3-methyl-6-methoxy-1,4-benzoquinone monooxygenase [Gammaproteobacteria bacterium]|nr:MAG: 2-polyprenyl-3-methyl-6-methoxy-1,4-benzoquinone monooxygenase [Gammaproteobacteria bacterium]
MPTRRLTPLDRLLAGADNLLRTLAVPATAARANPAADTPEAPLDDAERAHVAGLMRVNHAGEVAAQALYHGQALLARDEVTAEYLAGAAREEGDHLAWCRERLEEIGARPSRLDPLWYLGAFTVGAAAAAAGDRLSLGFVEETERQVVEHLEGHMRQLPETDERSRRILRAMALDEAEHGDAARAAGARRLPWAARRAMRMAARVMTATAYRI